MQIIKFVLALILTIVLIFTLDLNHPYGSSLPPLGRFLNPFNGVWQNAGNEEPQNKELRLPGVHEEVQVVFDERMVPHIFAQNDEDAFYAQGYVVASFRLWQMEMSTRAAGGRLSEVMGERTLERDKSQRRKGILWAAERAWQAWQQSPEEKKWVEAYTRGVNDYIDQLSAADYPLEYKLLNHKPEHWTPVKSALFFKSMAETLCSRNQDIGLTNARALLGPELFSELYPENNPRQSPIIPAGTPWDFTPLALDPLPDTTREMFSELAYPYPQPPQPSPFLGSNNWAVAGSKTADGYPILCNDPHLNLSLPSIWFEVQLQTPEYNAYGVALPGIPGIAIGFNEYFAWGETNVGQDVLDWYRITWRDDQKQEYILDGETEPVEIRNEAIKVLGKRDPVMLPVKYTIWGPVVNEHREGVMQDLAMRWVALDADPGQNLHELGTFVGLMKGKNYEDYSQALKAFDTPPQNFVFASRDGDIAIKVNGRFPLRRPEQGRFIQDGSSSAQAWQGFIPKEQVPQVHNPARGFVSSANQRSTDDTYPYYYLGGFDDYRGRQVNRLLDKMTGIRVEDMMTMQNDNYSIKAEEGVPALLGQLDQSKLSEQERQMLSDLSSWDFRFEADRKVPFVFTSWLDAAYRLTFDEIAQAAQDNRVISYPDNWLFVQLIYENPNHIIFDVQGTPEKENAREVITLAFHEMAETLQEKYADDNYNWADFKATNIPHLGGIPGFDSGLLEVGGYSGAINAISAANGPSWRMIVHLGPEVKAWGVFPGGQSGNPASPYYDNAVEKWRKGEYYQLHFLRSPEAAAELSTTTWKLQAK